jgi:hypothetical protein
MRDLITEIRARPSPGNCAIAGMLLVGAVGVIAGLYVGLRVHGATAYFAMFELGIPAAFAGAAGGFLVGCVFAVASP